MKIEVIPPCKDLAGLVKLFWVLEKGDSLHVERLFPNGEQQLIFHYGNPFLERTNTGAQEKQPEFLCCGQFIKYRDIISASGAGLIGVVFHPYSITGILNIPANEISGSPISLESISRNYKDLGCKVQDAKNTSERIRIIERFLLHGFSIKNKCHFDIVKESVRCISGSSPELELRKLPERFCLSQRQYERIFRHYVGLAPKAFAGIIRFNRALKMIETPASLTEITFSAGYYDQPHFIQSFKEFTGYTPGEYRARLKKVI